MKSSLFAAGAIAALALGGAAQAQDYQPSKAGTWIIDVRATDVSPSTSNAITTGSGAPTGLHVHVSDSYVPTLGFTYFVTNHWAVEAILGTSFHQVKAVGPGVDLAVRDTWVLPPVVAVQYHFLPAAKVDPYLGAGVNYMLFYDGSNKNGFTVKTPNGFGYAVQAGANVALKGAWLLNADVKKVYFETNASVDNGALKSNVHLDPWVISLGVGRKF
jgi:outer membrane protein